MRILSTKLQGVLDYPLAIIIFTSQWIFDFDQRMAKHVTVLVGASLILLNILTNYEMGLLRIITVRLHLTIEFLLGLVLASSPLLFDFYEFVYLPHLLLGLIVMGLSLITKRVSSTHEARPSQGR